MMQIFPKKEYGAFKAAVLRIFYLYQTKKGSSMFSVNLKEKSSDMRGKW